MPSPFELALLAALVIFVITVATVVLRSRKRYDRDLRAVLATLEEMRGAEAPAECAVGDGSPLGAVADAVNRLGQDLGEHREEAAEARERWRSLRRRSGHGDPDHRHRRRRAELQRGCDPPLRLEESEVVARPAAVVFEEGSYKELLPKLARRSPAHPGDHDTRRGCCGVTAPPSQRRSRFAC